MEQALETQSDSLKELYEKCFSAKNWNYFVYGFEDIMEFFGSRGWDRWKFVIESRNLFEKVVDYPDLFSKDDEERLYEFYDLIIGNGLDNNIRLPNEPGFPEWWDYMEKALWKKDI